MKALNSLNEPCLRNLHNHLLSSVINNAGGSQKIYLCNPFTQQEYRILGSLLVAPEEHMSLLSVGGGSQAWRF